MIKKRPVDWNQAPGNPARPIWAHRQVRGQNAQNIASTGRMHRGTWGTLAWGGGHNSQYEPGMRNVEIAEQNETQSLQHHRNQAYI